MLHIFIFLALFFSQSLSQNVTCVNRLSQAQKDALLQSHNQYRSLIAQGGVPAANGVLLPPASNMKEMIWDDELETLAQGWANNNPQTHNPNRVVPSAPTDQVGENIYWENGRCSNKKEAGVFNVSVALASWFGESKLFDGNVTNYGSQKSNGVGHFTQVIWADTLRVGCGIYDCVTTTPQPRYTLYSQATNIVCNYRVGGNVWRQALYKIGQACSGCQGTCSNNYIGLCAA